jgi:uncharacterized membrane protein YdjX (TVP38/TMEM64 family)
MAESTPRPNRGLLLKLAVAGVVLLVAVALVARGIDLKGLLAQGLELIRSAGAPVFFIAMALLPAIGAPQMAFSLTAGPVFGPTLGMGWVVTFALLAMAVNMTLSYYLASRALRPLLEKLFTRLGYQLPKATPGAEFDLIILLRVTPGIPFPVQNYLLGLAQVPFGQYLLVSCLVQWPMNAAFILFGDALLHGKGRVAFSVLCVILALMAGTQLVRKRYAKKRA